MQQFYPAINMASKKSFVNTFKIFFFTVMLFTTSALFAQVITNQADPHARSCARKPFSNGRSQNFINTTSVAQELERRKSQMTPAERSSIATRAASRQITSHPAFTQSFFLTGTLSGTDPTYNRSLTHAQGGSCTLSSVGTATHYKTHTFTLAAASNVIISVDPVDGGAVSPAGSDTYLELYNSVGFVPASACTNSIMSDDDAGPGFTSKMVTTTPLAAGTYTVVVTSFDNEPTDFPWNYTLAILFTDPSAGCTTGNKISDGSFESTNFDLTNPFWATFSTNFDSPLCDGGTCGTGGGTAGARTGSFWSWFGGVALGNAEDGSLEQSVTIPASSTTILNFYLWIGAVDAPFDATLKVKVDGVVVATYTEPSVAEAGYTLRTINISSFGDNNLHAIKFEYSNSAASGISNFNLDDVSVDVVSCSPCVAPSITGQPASVTKCTGTNTTFTAGAAGTIASYQWQVNTGSGFTNLINNAPYSGVTTTTLTIAGSPVALNGNKYRLLVTGYCGGPITSNEATLTLNETVHTASIATPSSVCAPGATLITGTASGTATSNYTHTLTGPGTIVQNASTGTNNANASFSVTAIPAGSQIYALTSTNTEGCIATSSVFITVNPIPVVTIAPAAPAICNGAIQQLTATVTPPIPQVANGGGAITIPAAGVATPYASQFAVTGLPTGTTLKSITLNGFNHTFPGDLDIVLQSPSGANVILMSDRGGGTDIVNATIVFDDAAAAILPNSAIVSGTYKPTNTTGPDNFPAPGPGSITQVNPTLASLGAADYNGIWKLFIIDNATPDGGSIGSWSLTFNVPASVTYSPVTNLFADAAATIPYVAGTPVFGSVYAKPAATTTYTATATRNGCTASGTVTVTVNQLPAITVQPTPATQIACPGSNVTYSVTATGTGLTYQWRLGGVPLVNGLQASGSTVSGATTNSLTIAGVLAADAGNYDVVVSGTCPPSVTSSAVAFVIASAPTITTQPGNAAICEGGNVSFTLAAAGTPAPTFFQWQVSTAAVPAFTNIVGVNTATLSITGVTLAMNGNKYRVIVTNTCGQSVTSNGLATLTINAVTVPTITALPATICLSDAPIALTGGSPVGGSFTGIGVSGSNFVPAVTAVGNFTLTYTYTNTLGCTATATTVARVTDCPERLRLLRDKGVIVYPIPNNGNFSFRVNSTLYNYLNLKVYTSAGGLLSTRNYSGLTYGQVVPVDLSNLPSGTYMLRFFYEDGARTSEKVIPVIIVHD